MSKPVTGMTSRERRDYAEKFITRLVGDIENGSTLIVNFRHSEDAAWAKWELAVIDAFMPTLGNPSRAKELAAEIVRNINRDYEATASENWFSPMPARLLDTTEGVFTNPAKRVGQ